MRSDQFSLQSLLIVMLCAGVGLGMGRIAATMQDNGPLGIMICCLAGSVFGIAHWTMFRHRYAAMLFGFISSATVAAATLPAVVMK